MLYSTASLLFLVSHRDSIILNCCVIIILILHINDPHTMTVNQVKATNLNPLRLSTIVFLSSVLYCVYCQCSEFISDKQKTEVPGFSTAVFRNPFQPIAAPVPISLTAKKEYCSVSEG